MGGTRQTAAQPVPENADADVGHERLLLVYGPAIRLTLFPGPRRARRFVRASPREVTHEARRAYQLPRRHRTSFRNGLMVILVSPPLFRL
ncbi:hypothetical protein SSAG_03664 [Streptomyces sp. Mg1]|nr:hypothetical protein SSAG_03664 [Streptomyces sp. Mg1]